ncbi:MAG: YkvA family protein [Burkholderiaceae bacterium]
MKLLETLRSWARLIKRDVVAVYFAARNPRTPLMVRLLALAVAGYALSPIDLIPDFIPVLGYLDDLLIVPAGLMLVIRLLPADILDLSRAQAADAIARPTSHLAAAFVVGLWIVALALCTYFWWTWK